jgi:integrase/recombinase XerD
MGPVGFESRVRIPKSESDKRLGKPKYEEIKQTFKMLPLQYTDTRYVMRDLYNRKYKLEYWIRKVHTELQNEDRVDVLKLVGFMQDHERSILWIVRCITALLLVRKQLDKPFRNATREDIRNILKWMDQKEYKKSTNEKFRQILKLFYKIVYGNNEIYPDQIKWFSTKLGKEKSGKDPSMEMSEYLEETEIQKMIKAAPTLQKKAFVATLYESGARPEEFLRLANVDIRFDSNGAVLMLRGKTGERRVRIIAFATLLQQWIEVHPFKSESCYQLWISEATNFKGGALGLRGAEKWIAEILHDAALSEKHARLYILRHSRATHLAKHLTEAQMCVFFGWVQGTQVVRRYIHLSGKDVDSVLLAINEIVNEQVQIENYRLKPVRCTRCAEILSPGMNFCSRCSLPVDVSKTLTREMELEKENKELKERYETDMARIRQEIDQKFDMVVSMIKENPKLAQIKPNVLMSKQMK